MLQGHTASLEPPTINQRIDLYIYEMINQYVAAMAVTAGSIRIGAEGRLGGEKNEIIERTRCGY